MGKTDEEIEQCVNMIAKLEEKFGADVVYKASRRYYDRIYSKYDFVE